MRLFFAILLSESVRNELSEIQKSLRDMTLKGNFTLNENMHLTMVFLGDIEALRLSDLHQVLLAIRSQAFKVVIDHPGVFKKREGQIIWLGIESVSELFSLQEKLSCLLRNQGFRFDDKPFSPHVTLARGVRTKNGDRDIKLDFKPISVEVNRLSLMISERVDNVLRYREIEGIDL